MEKKHNNDEPEICACTVIHDDAVAEVRANMPEDSTIQNLSAFFKAIGDETRIRILLSLAITKMCVCDIAAAHGMSVSAISHQLRILKQAHLVKYDKQGKVVYYSLDDIHVNVMFKNALDHVLE